VISIEALRADRLWLSDHEPDITPNLRKLAASSTAFRRTYSASPSTIESLASLWSSQSPTEIQWEAGNLKQIAPETPWLPSTLDSNGYSTFAFLFHYKRFHKDKGVGFDRGFRVYDTSTLVGYAPGNFYGFPSGQVVDRAIEAIDRSFEPFLVWAHLAEPHAEYEQPPSAPVFGTSAEDRYAAEIWEADRQVGRVIEHLERSGLIEDTVVLITGDHGESFGDHGLTHHGKSLYEAQVRTLGLLRVPGVSARIVEQPVGHRDFGVTVMNLLGVRDGFERLSGVNLLPLVAGQPEQVRPVVLERLDADDRRPVLSGIVQWPFKLIHRHASASARLFNLEEDPGETTDISDDEPEALRLLTESFHGHLTRRPAPL
jgi:arylsulfatase A-like enzyme